jgi:phospholipid/cholesterol/gamma-HCH transport system permease protein
MEWVSEIGRAAVRRLRGGRLYVSAVGATAVLCLLPGTWTAMVRRSLSRQIVSIGFEGLWLTTGAALLVGVSVVVQAEFWLHRFGQSQWLGPLLAVVVIRELGPLLANLITIARSGSSMVVELGNMKLAGEVRVLDGLGIDRFRFLVVPRSAGMAISTFCLTIVLIVLSLLVGCLAAGYTGVAPRNPTGFLSDVTDSVGVPDLLNILVKSLVPGLSTGTICCMHALAVTGHPGAIRHASSLAVQRSIVAMFVVSAVVSVITYS